MSKTEEFDEKCYVNTLEILKLLEDMNERIENIEKNTKPRYMQPNTDKGLTYENKKKVYLTKLNNKEILQPKQTTLDYYKIKYNQKDKVYYSPNEE